MLKPEDLPRLLPAAPHKLEVEIGCGNGHFLVEYCRRNPDSLFHLSVGISYPNEADIAFAEAQGRSPGKDIFIHGGPRRGVDPTNVRDWTAGCISVKDREIEEVYAMVRDGTPIDIFA